MQKNGWGRRVLRFLSHCVETDVGSIVPSAVTKETTHGTTNSLGFFLPGTSREMKWRQTKQRKQLEGGRHDPVLRTQEQRRLVLAVRGGVHGGTGAGAHER